MRKDFKHVPDLHEFSLDLSVVIPTLGWSDYFDESLGSAIEHTSEETEIVVSLNGCKLAEFGSSRFRSHDKVRWIESSERRVPLHESWNLAVSHASKYWVLLLSDDDYITEGFLDDPEAQLVQEEALYYPRPRIVDAEGVELRLGPAPRQDLLFGKHLKHAALDGRFLAHASSFVYPRNLWLDVGGYEAVGYPNGFFVDTVFNLKLLGRVRKVYVDHRPVFSRRLSAGHITGEILIGPKVRGYLRSVCDSLWSDQASRNILKLRFRSRNHYLKYIAGIRFITEWNKSVMLLQGDGRQLRLKLFFWSQLSWPLGFAVRFALIVGVLRKNLNSGTIFRATNIRLAPITAFFPG